MRPQAEPRFNKRMPCRLRVGPSAYGGMVLNVSRNGFFVQTNAQTRRGEEVWIDLAASGRDRIPIAGRVVWRRVVAAPLRSVTQGGVGVRIKNAPESWYRFLEGVAREAERTAPRSAAPASSASAAPAPEPFGSAWRVRLKLEAGSRSRTLVVHGASEAEAKRRALAQAGDGWVVLEALRAAGLAG